MTHDIAGRHIWTWSRATSSQACPMKGHLRYNLGWRRSGQPSKALRVGSAFHEALDTAFSGSGVGIVEIIEEITEDAHEAAYVTAIVTAYLEHWKGDGWEVIESELDFDIEVHNSRFMGAIDSIVKVPDGRLMVVERKTTSDDIAPGSNYWWAMRINGQPRWYTHAARESGYDVSGMILDVVHKPTAKPKQTPVLDSEGLKVVTDEATGLRLKNKNGTWKQSPTKTSILWTEEETPEEYGHRVYSIMNEDPGKYFQRHELPASRMDLERTVSDVEQMASSAAQAESYAQLVTLPARNTAQCNVSGRRCPFLDICDRDWRHGDTPPDGYEQLDWVHPELPAPMDLEQ